MRRSILLVFAFGFLLWAVHVQAQFTTGTAVNSGSSGATAAPTQTPTQTPTPIALSAVGGFYTTGTGLAFNNSYYTSYNGLNSQISNNAPNTVTQPMSSIYTVKNLYCECLPANGVGGGVPGNTISFIYYNNTGSADTALKCSMQGSATSCSDTSDTFNSAAGSYYNIRVFISPGATPTSTLLFQTCQCSVGP